MCLAIPGKIISINDTKETIFRSGEISFDGVIREVNLAAVPEARVGDYVLIHVGMAITVVDEEEAEKSLALFRQMDDKSPEDL